MEIAENQGAFLAWVKQIMEPARNRPRGLIVTKAFCKGYRESYGDDDFYDLTEVMELWGNKQASRYIRRFRRRYEKKIKQKSLKYFAGFKSIFIFDQSK